MLLTVSRPVTRLPPAMALSRVTDGSLRLSRATNRLIGRGCAQMEKLEIDARRQRAPALWGRGCASRGKQHRKEQEPGHAAPHGPYHKTDFTGWGGFAASLRGKYTGFLLPLSLRSPHCGGLASLCYVHAGGNPVVEYLFLKNKRKKIMRMNSDSEIRILVFYLGQP